MNENTTLFDYDDAYDKLHSEPIKQKKDDRSKKHPRFLQNLFLRANERECERAMMLERNELRARKREEAEFGIKRSYVTIAYKKKLDELYSRIEDKNKLESKNGIENVTKQETFFHFHQNLLNQNTAPLGEKNEAIAPVIKGCIQNSDIHQIIRNKSPHRHVTLQTKCNIIPNHLDTRSAVIFEQSNGHGWEDTTPTQLTTLKEKTIAARTRYLEREKTRIGK